MNLNENEIRIVKALAKDAIFSHEYTPEFKALIKDLFDKLKKGGN
jgi:hypothetical protein